MDLEHASLTGQETEISRLNIDVF